MSRRITESPPVFLAGCLLVLLVTDIVYAAPTTQPLPPSTSLIAGDVETFKLIGGGAGKAMREVVPVAGQPFAKAVRVRTIQRPQFHYQVQLNASTAAPVAKGDALLLSFWLRTVEAANEEGEAYAGAVFERRGQPYNKSLDYKAGAGGDWKQFHMPFAADDAYAAGAASVLFQLGFGAQTIEIGGVELRNFGSAVRVADLPRTVHTYRGGEPDAPWRKAAAERIERVRKGDLTVTVTDAAGKPVPGAAVMLRMKRHAFAFGSAVDGRLLLADTPDALVYQGSVAGMFNQVVLENDLKWPMWEANRQRGLDAVKWLRDRRIAVRGHTLIWPGWKYMPNSVAGLKDRPDELRKAIAGHITEEATALRGQLVDWDVVNEPWSNHDVQDILGKEVLVEWFKLARAADPAARLFINDYPKLTAPASADAHLEAYEATIRGLIAAGAPLEGIGFQCHYGRDFTPPELILKGLDHFAQFGKPVVATEFDMATPDEDLQADVTRDLLTVMFSHPAVDGVLMWGFWEGRHWKPEAAMFRKDWSVKPNGRVWTDLVRRQWWTNADGNTGTDGAYRVRGFLGDYDITVRAGGKTKYGKATVKKEGAAVKMVLE